MSDSVSSIVGFCHSRILGSPQFFGCNAKASAGATNNSLRDLDRSAPRFLMMTGGRKTSPRKTDFVQFAQLLLDVAPRPGKL
jgi:hypothetical protein